MYFLLSHIRVASAANLFITIGGGSGHHLTPAAIPFIFESLCMKNIPFEHFIIVKIKNTNMQLMKYINISKSVRIYIFD